MNFVMRMGTQQQQVVQWKSVTLPFLCFTEIGNQLKVVIITNLEQKQKSA